MSEPTITDQLAAEAPSAEANLSEVQEWMAELIRHPKGLAKSEAMRTAAAQHFTGNERLSPAEQINIYRQQFWLRHTGALIEDFPGLTGLLGQKAWEKLALGYLTQRDHLSFALKNMGEQMAAHLEQLEGFDFEKNYVTRSLLVDMARLEWAYVRAFDVRDDSPLSQEKLAAIAPDAWARARFVLSDSVSLLRLSYPVPHLRRALKTDPKSVNKLEIKEEPQNLVVYRREGLLWDKRVSDAAFLLLEQFHAGTPLVPACEAAIERDPTVEPIFEEELTNWFALWGRLGWIVDVNVD